MPSSSSSSASFLAPPFVGLGPRLAALPRRGLGELRAHLFFRWSSRPIVGHPRRVDGRPGAALRFGAASLPPQALSKPLRDRLRPQGSTRAPSRHAKPSWRAPGVSHGATPSTALFSSVLQLLATAEPWKPRPAAKALKYHGLTGSAAPARESPASSPSRAAGARRPGPSRRTPG